MTMLLLLPLVPVDLPKEPPAKGQVVVAEVGVGDAKKGAVFAVSVGDCSRPRGAPKDQPADCVVVVALKKGGAGKMRLEWTAKSGSLSRPNDNSVVIGAGEDAMTVRWRPIAVGNVNQNLGVHGLMVTQETHGEKSKRRHDVFLVRRGKLDHAFTGREGRGSRTWSALEAVDIDHDGGSEIVLMLASTDDEEQADLWEMQVYGFRADIGKVVARNDLRPRVMGGVVGMFKTVADARKLAANPCAKELLVLDSKSADLLADGQVVLAYPAVSRADAELALETVRACNEALAGAVKPLHSGVEVDGDE